MKIFCSWRCDNDGKTGRQIMRDAPTDVTRQKKYALVTSEAFR